MATPKHTNRLLLLLCTLFFAAYAIQGNKAEAVVPYQSVSHLFPSQNIARLQSSEGIWVQKNSRRLMIGSTAPTCTYNECRGCRYRCRAEQVPVEGNDPINSAYHYRCVCHR